MPMSWVMDPAREPMIAVEMDGQRSRASTATRPG